jgi:hypothetical protein
MESLMNTEFLQGRYLDTVYQDSVSLPYFGIFSMSIKEAAERVVLDMWFSGDFSEIKEPEDWDCSVSDPRLRILLTDQISKFTAKLIAAVDSGRLESARTSRNLDEQLIPEKTFIKYQSLYQWLQERGYECGDTLDAWSNSEMEIAMRLCEELTYLRSVKNQNNSELVSYAFHGERAKTGAINEAEITDVIDAYKALVIENKHLEDLLAQARSEHFSKIDRPLETRQRRTLLTIIAALCNSKTIDPADKNTPGWVSDRLELMGALVSAETIKKLFDEIPEALESKTRNGLVDRKK